MMNETKGKKKLTDIQTFDPILQRQNMKEASLDDLNITYNNRKK